MRIQILTLPTVFVGDDMQEPFALVFDQAEDGIHKELWASFAHLCGAKNHIIVPQTVEIVDRYAEPAKADPVVHIGELRITDPPTTGTGRAFWQVPSEVRLNPQDIV